MVVTASGSAARPKSPSFSVRRTQDAPRPKGSAGVTTLRSPSMNSIPAGSSRSVSPSMSVVSSSSARTSLSARRKGLADAKRASDKELQKHLQSMLVMKQNLRRVHDEIAKEYSTLTVAMEAAVKVSNNITTDSATEGEGSLLALVKRSNSPEEVVEHLRQEGFGEEDIRKQIHFIAILQRHHRQLEDHLTEAKIALNELCLKDREVQHVATLVDRACDVDLQCMNEASLGDSIMCNGSPMFPNRTIEDTDKVIEEASELCAKAGRLSLFIRKLMSTGKAEADRSAHDLALAMSIATRISKQKLTSTKQEIQGLDYEIGRVNLLRAELLQSLRQVEERYVVVQRTIALRETAKDTIKTRAGQDPVCVAMRHEKEELELRLEELKLRQDALDAELKQLTDDKAVYQQTLVDAVQRADACRRIATKVPPPTAEGLAPSRAASFSGSARGTRAASNFPQALEAPSSPHSVSGSMYLLPAAGASQPTQTSVPRASFSRNRSFN